STGNLLINANGAGAITIGTGAVNMVGTITNSGIAGTVSNTVNITGAVGSNVTAITENSTSSALTVSGAIAVAGGGTTLTNVAGTAPLTVSGAISGTGNLILNNNSNLSNGIVVGIGIVNNAGAIINSGTGTGSVSITGAVKTAVVAITQNSAT